MQTRGSRPIGPALPAAGGALLFVAALFLPFQVRSGTEQTILDLDQGFRVWGSLAVGPLGVLIAAVAGGWLLLGPWSARRAAGLIIAAGLWGTLRGAAILGVSWFPGGAAGDAVDPGIGSYLAWPAESSSCSPGSRRSPGRRRRTGPGAGRYACWRW